MKPNKVTITERIVKKDKLGRDIYEKQFNTEHTYRYDGDTEKIVYYKMDDNNRNTTEEQIYEDGIEIVIFCSERNEHISIKYTENGMNYRYSCNSLGSEEWYVRSSNHKDVSKESVDENGVRTIETYDIDGKLIQAISSNGLTKIRNEKGKLITILPDDRKQVLATIHAAIKKNKNAISGFCGMYGTPKLTNLSDKSGDKHEIVLADSYHSASFTAHLAGNEIWFSSYIRGNEDLCAGGHQSKWVPINTEFSVKYITDIARELGCMAKDEKNQHAANY